VRPSASDYDKAEAKYIERSMDERDFGTADIDSAIADLKADFAHASRKSDLNVLSKRGGGGGGSAAHAMTAATAVGTTRPMRTAAVASVANAAASVARMDGAMTHATDAPSPSRRAAAGR
jgi:hypothetical protein